MVIFNSYVKLPKGISGTTSFEVLSLPWTHPQPCFSLRGEDRNLASPSTEGKSKNSPLVQKERRNLGNPRYPYMDAHVYI